MPDFSKMNPNDFTQKDLMLHLLQVSQHTVTREELKEDISKVENSVAKLDDKLTSLEAKFDDKITSLETNLKKDISKVSAKFDKIQWLIMATIITILLKDFIM